MCLTGRLLLLLFSAGLVVQVPLAAGQVSHLSSDVRERLAKAAQSSTAEPWQRSFMLELATASPDTSRAQSAPAHPGLAMPLSGNPAWSAQFPTGDKSSARYYFSTIQDPVRDRLVVFGGIDGLGPHNDAWA